MPHACESMPNDQGTHTQRGSQCQTPPLPRHDLDHPDRCTSLAGLARCANQSPLCNLLAAPALLTCSCMLPLHPTQMMPYLEYCMSHCRVLVIHRKHTCSIKCSAVSCSLFPANMARLSLGKTSAGHAFWHHQTRHDSARHCRLQVNAACLHAAMWGQSLPAAPEGHRYAEDTFAPCTRFLLAGAQHHSDLRHI